MNDYPYVPGWRLNKENNKPAVNHSVLMLTRHGVAEGEWNGNDWVQYRWSCKVKDSDVLYWIHLEDFTQLEKEGQPLQQEQPKFNVGDLVVSKKNPHLTYSILATNIPNELGKTDYKVEIFTDGKPGLLGKPHNIRLISSDKIEDWGELVQQVDLENEIALEWKKCKPTDEGMGLESANIVNEQFDYIARHFYELGLNVRKK